jgi:hypothetical protein
MHFQSRVVRAVTVGDIAQLYTDFEGTRIDESGKTGPVHNNAIEVLRRQSDGIGWKPIVGAMRFLCTRGSTRWNGRRRLLNALAIDTDFCRGSRVGCNATDSQAARLPPQISHDKPDYRRFRRFFTHRLRRSRSTFGIRGGTRCPQRVVNQVRLTSQARLDIIRRVEQQRSA